MSIFAQIFKVMKKLMILMSCAMMVMGIQARSAFLVSNDSIPADTTKVVADTLKVDKKKKEKKEEKKESEYEKIIKKGGTVMDGMFRVRHIEDKYYFEVPDSMMGRYILCVTRFTAVPQDFGMFAGEEITHSTVYFEKRMFCHIWQTMATTFHAHWSSQP